MTSVKTLKIEKDNISKFNKNFVNNQNYIFCVGEKNRVNKILKYINGIEKSNSISIGKQIFYALFKVSIIIILILLLIISFEFFTMIIFIILLYIFYKIKKIDKKNLKIYKKYPINFRYYSPIDFKYYSKGISMGNIKEIKHIIDTNYIFEENNKRQN